jgi:hypothetical protein
MRLRLRSGIRIARASSGDRRTIGRQLTLRITQLGGETWHMRRKGRGAAIVTNGIGRALRTHQRIRKSDEKLRITRVPTNGIVASVQIRLRNTAGGVALRRCCGRLGRRRSADGVSADPADMVTSKVAKTRSVAARAGISVPLPRVRCIMAQSP